MGVLELLILIFLAALIAGGVYLIRSSGSRGSVDPLCGNCGYNLTGCESNRCSECGLLFIQAGVIKGRRPASPNRRRAGIALILVPAVLIFGMIPTLYFYRRAQVERARAMQARQQAVRVQRFQESMLEAIRPASPVRQVQQFLQSMVTETRPASPATRPSDRTDERSP